MTELLIQPDELRKSADEFSRAGKEIQAILTRLNDTTGELEKNWAGASQQIFFKQYLELRQYLEGFAGLLSNIQLEMQAMADRYESIDQ